jgi:hypothetical protein
MTTPPITDPAPITATDPRVAKILAMIQAKTAAPPVQPTDVQSQQQIAPVVAPPVPTQLGGPSLAQQMPQNVPPPPPQAPMPQMAPPQAPQLAAPPTPNVVPPSQPGPVKSFLQHLVSGLGTTAYAGTQGALQRLGIPTDYEKQQDALKIGLQQQQQDSLEGLRKAQADLASGRSAQVDQLTAPYAIDQNDESVLPQFRGKTTTFAGYQALQKLSEQSQTKTDVANIAANAGAVKISPEYAARLGVPALAGQTVGGKQLASMNRMLQGTGSNIMEGDIGNGHVGLIDKDSKQVLADYGPSQRIIGAGIYAQNRSVQVVNPNDPNATIQMAPSKANATGAQGTQSVGYQANKAVTKYFTSGDGAKNLNAFNTATAHLQQLGTVADALGNGNVQAFNKLGQNYAQQTGSTAPTNFDAVKAAVAGEIGKVFKGGNATDQEISEMNSTINRAQSPQQLKGVIQTYTDLMGSKRNALQQQYQQGKQGQPNFSESNIAPEGTVVHMADGSTQVKRGGQWVAQ